MNLRAQERMQEKWSKSISDGTISVKEQLYTLKVTGNKRHLNYNEDGLLINTPCI